jgi:hypothetical protein
MALSLPEMQVWQVSPPAHVRGLVQGRHERCLHAAAGIHIREVGGCLERCGGKGGKGGE